MFGILSIKTIRLSDETINKNYCKAILLLLLILFSRPNIQKPSVQINEPQPKIFRVPKYDSGSPRTMKYNLNLSCTIHRKSKSKVIQRTKKSSSINSFDRSFSVSNGVDSPWLSSDPYDPLLASSLLIDFF